MGRVRKHPTDSIKVLLQGRVDPEARERARRMADACGASASLMLEQMVMQQPLDELGRPVWWEAFLAATSAAEQNEGQLPMSA